MAPKRLLLLAASVVAAQHAPAAEEAAAGVACLPREEIRREELLAQLQEEEQGGLHRNHEVHVHHFAFWLSFQRTFRSHFRIAWLRTGSGAISVTISAIASKQYGEAS